MSKIEVFIELNARPSVVWTAIEPIEAHVEWMADAVAIRFETDQRRGVGTQFLCDTKVGPIRLTDRMEITEWVPQHAIGVRHTGVVSGTGRFTLTPIGDGQQTRFGWSEELTFPWWLGGFVGEFLGGRLVLKSIWRRNLRALKSIVEAQTC
ncbi:MAG: SRPBCC family protein [Ilumatobacteraceae bacterium]